MASNKKATTISLTPQGHEALEEMARFMGLSRSGVVETMIREKARTMPEIERKMIALFAQIETENQKVR